MSIPTNVIAIIFGLFVYTTITEDAYTQTQDLDTQSRALELITKTADSICNHL